MGTAGHSSKTVLTIARSTLAQPIFSLSSIPWALEGEVGLSELVDVLVVGIVTVGMTSVGAADVGIMDVLIVL